MVHIRILVAFPARVCRPDDPLHGVVPAEMQRWQRLLLRLPQADVAAGGAHGQDSCNPGCKLLKTIVGERGFEPPPLVPNQARW